MNTKKVLAEVRARTAAMAACQGHHFSGPSERPMSRGWRCDNCAQLFDAHEIHMYEQGLQHAEKGHKASNLFPEKKITPDKEDLL